MTRAAAKRSRMGGREIAHERKRQTGVIMFIVLMLLGLMVSALVIGLTGNLAQRAKRERQTADALAEAKQALIGRAAADNSIPGSLPCPDLDNDGVAELFAGNDCPSYVGRLPWRTLGLPDLRDGSSERLWYALSPNFRDHPSAQPLNSETPGQLAVTGNAPAANVIAIVFAPGAPVGSQVRDAPNANNMVNYLEGENANGVPPVDNTFTTALASSTFNDELLPITREDLFPVVEMRIARELRSILRAYYTANRFYPHAGQFPNNTSTAATYQGYIPTTTCAPVPALALPAWFSPNNWHQLTVYAVAPRCTPKISSSLQIFLSPQVCALAPCSGPLFGLYLCSMPNAIDNTVLNCNYTGAGPYLTVNGVGTNIQSLVFSASYRLGVQPARPCNAIADCLEAVNGNNENINNDYIYMKPVRTSTNNDSLLIVAP
jgi:type II secretory pathway pseudopilin PulG